MRSRFLTVLFIVGALASDGSAPATSAAQAASAVQPAAVPLLARILDTVAGRPVQIPGTVASVSNAKGTITLKLINEIPGSDSAELYLVGAAGDAAGLARFNPGDNLMVSGVLQRNATARTDRASFFVIPQTVSDVAPIGWTHLGRERLTIGIAAAFGLLFLIAVPLRTRETNDTELEPMHLETESTPRTLTPGFTRTARSTSARVLLIEDEPLVRLAARRGLERNGFEVEEASCGADAMALWHESSESFDCVVSDVILPGSMGPDVVEQMRSDRHEIPVLFVSGQAKRLNPAVLLEPHTAFLQKPFGSKQLSDALAALLNPSPLAA